MSSCKKFSQLRDNYGEYVRKLLDYYWLFNINVCRYF